MKAIPVKKATLMTTIQKNRDRHREVFESALEGYQQESIRILREQMDRAEKGLRQNLQVYLICPEDHTKDYDRVLGMLSMSIDDTIELTEQDYSQYIEDNWMWKQQWVGSNSSYSMAVTETPGYSEYAGE